MHDLLLPNPLTIISDLFAENTKEFLVMGLQLFITLVIAISYRIYSLFKCKNKYIIFSCIFFIMCFKLIWAFLIVNKYHQYWIWILLFTLYFIYFEIIIIKIKRYRILYKIIFIYVCYLVLAGSLYVSLGKVIYIPDSFFLASPEKRTKIENRYLKYFYWNLIPYSISSKNDGKKTEPWNILL